MLEDEVHFVSMAVDAGEAAAKRGDQIVHRDKQHVGQYRPFDMTPQPFDHVQARAIRRQPEDVDLVPMRSEPLPDSLGLMKPPIVTDQTNLSPGISGDQGHQKDKKVPAAFGPGHRLNDLAALVIDPAIDHLLMN